MSQGITDESGIEAILGHVVTAINNLQTAQETAVDAVERLITHMADPNAHGGQKVTDIAGNAGTATRLLKEIAIKLTGAVTGSVSGVNGSEDVTIATTALDVGKATAGVLGVARGGTGNATGAAASCTGNAATATKLGTARAISTSTTSTTTSGNFDGSAPLTLGVAVTTAAGTAAKTLPPTTATAVQSWLITARNCLDWLVARFDTSGKALTAVTAGSCTGNASTATKWATARKLTLKGAVTGSVPQDGSEDVALDTTLSAHAASHNPLTGSDPLTFVRYPASSTTTIYIRPGGSDTNDGRTAATAKATLQGAIIEGTKYDIRGTATMFFDIAGTVPLYPETSSGNISLSLRNAGLSDRLTIRGSGTSSSKITNNGNGAYLQAIQGLSLYIQDIAVDCRVYGTGPGSTVQFSGDILFGENAGGGAYVLTASDGQVSFSSSARVTVAAKSQNGFVYADGSSSYFRASAGCSIEFLTEQSYGVGTLRTARGGQISWDNVTIPSTSKTVTGRKYYLEGAGDSIQSAYLDTIPGTLPGHGLARGYIAGIPVDMTTLVTGDSGYVKLQNGFILQWVRVGIPALPVGDTSYPVTFPIAFPTAYLGAWINVTTQWPGNLLASVRGLSRSAASAHVRANVATNYEGYLYILAIGH